MWSAYKYLLQLFKVLWVVISLRVFSVRVCVSEMCVRGWPESCWRGNKQERTWERNKARLQQHLWTQRDCTGRETVPCPGKHEAGFYCGSTGTSVKVNTDTETVMITIEFGCGIHGLGVSVSQTICRRYNREVTNHKITQALPPNQCCTPWP